MSKLSEEEIINAIKPIVNARKTHKDDNLYSLQLNAYQLDTIQGILDLYNKEKQKNKELDKIKFIITDKLPPDMKYNVFCNTDFERLFGNDYISKDKIREALGIEEDMTEEKILSLIETLMSEVNRLEDIEDRKVQVECNNVFNKGVKSVEAKIRDKIKELENSYNQLPKNPKEHLHSKTEYKIVIGELQELLGEGEIE